MTHSHALDLDIVAAALKARRFPYVGLIGSDLETLRAAYTRLEGAAFRIAESMYGDAESPAGAGG